MKPNFINDNWKLLTAIFATGGFVASMTALTIEVAQLKTAVQNKQRLNDRAHYFIAQKIAKTSGPLSMEDMETLGLLESQANRRSEE